MQFALQAAAKLKAQELQSLVIEEENISACASPLLDFDQKRKVQGYICACIGTR